MKHVNTDSHTRVWLHLKNPKTFATLELKPGEAVNLPFTVDDPYLKPMQPPAKQEHTSHRKRPVKGRKSTTEGAG
jgi:hypothetical protein